MHIFLRPKTNKGFTLLYASLVTSLLLALSLTIYTIIVRELKLSGYGRESQLAIYAADTGAECALYWDYVRSAFSSTTPSATIRCGEGTVPVSTRVVGSTSYHEFTLTLDDEKCADVTIRKAILRAEIKWNRAVIILAKQMRPSAWSAQFA